MAHLGTKTETFRFRLSPRDLASIRKLARNDQVTVAEMLRTLIRRAKVAQAGAVLP